MIADYRYLGLTTGPHPMALLREDAAFHACLAAADRAELLQGRLLVVKGTVERDGEVVHVIAGHVEDLTDKLMGLSVRPDAGESFRSRNFH